MNDFEQEVIQRLTRIETSTDERLGAIEDHLKTLNGKVVKQEQENFQRQLDLQQHATSCPNAGRIAALENDSIAANAEKDVKKNWLSGMSPVIWFLVGCFVILVLMHASEIKAMVGK